MLVEENVNNDVNQEKYRVAPIFKFEGLPASFFDLMQKSCIVRVGEARSKTKKDSKDLPGLI